jgi:hypothetical protein
VTYGNPFPTGAVAEASVFQQYVVQGPSSSVAVTNGTFALLPITDPTCSNPVDFTPTIAIASHPVLDQTVLDRDVKLTIDPTERPSVTWSVAADGPHDMFIVQILELLPSGGILLVPRAQVTTLAPPALFEPGVLVAGHTYVILVGGVVGLPGAAAGDFATFAYPFQRSFTFSHIVTIQ